MRRRWTLGRELGWEVLLCFEAGTTFKKLPMRTKADLTQEKGHCVDGRQPVDDQAPVLDIGDRRHRRVQNRMYAAAFG